MHLSVESKLGASTHLIVKEQRMRRILLVLGLAVCPSNIYAQVEDRGWPRLYTDDGHRVMVHQPQVESWEDRKDLAARAVVAVTPKGASDAFFGVIQLEMTTSIDFDSRTVLLKRRRPAEVRFPSVQESDEASLVAIVKAALPDKRAMLYSLDRILAAFEASKQPRRTVDVNLDPPPIIYSESPSILVMFRGEPEFQPVKGTELLYASNTNWDLFLETGSSRYFLLDEDSWLTTPDLIKGPWTPATDLPIGFWKLPKDKNWEEVRQQLPGNRTESVPIVFVTNTPAELIVTEDAPFYKPIPGTRLFYVSNTDSDLFLHSQEKQHYYLAAGRWFKAESLDGPWSAATKELPDDFARIPQGHARDRVLVSVPGTDEAEDAIFLATIPRKATVNRQGTTVEVAYEGAPNFVLVDGMKSVHYASNTPYDVFRVKESYYACYQGIWFASSSPTGPWVVCDSVPDEIYTIPPTSPMYNVTYVRVYESTPDTVVVGYTSGYVGTYVAYGVLLFGAGYYLYHHDHHWHYHYHPHYFSYGCRARYSYYYGGYYRSARYYGPYGGAGRWSAYNPHTGTYSRGAYRYGPRGGVYAREAYNPYSDRYAGRVTGGNRYGSWGRTVVASDDAWARAGHRSGPRGAVVGFETSEGARGIAGKGRYGNDFKVVKNKDGDLYVGRDGNVYRKKDGEWQRRRGGSWGSANRTGTARTQRTRPGASTRPRTESDVYRGLSREARTRQRGNSRVRSYRSYHSASGGSRGGARGGGRRR